MKYPEDFINKIICGDCLEVMKYIPDNSIDLVIIDPPYQEGFTYQFNLFKSKIKNNGQMLWFIQPIELYDLFEKPIQILIWEEPMSPKPNRRKYREFLDFVAWYAYEDYTFHNLLWNLMNSRFNDVVIRDKRLHRWEKPQTLIEKFLLIHTNPGDKVLDPFIGSGTTALACKQLNRDFIGIDISQECVDLANQRLIKL